MGNIMTSFPHGISTPFVTPGGGIPWMGGNNYFVGGTSAGNSGNDGKDPDHALDTIANALDKCTANNGDVIHVMPGYTETVATDGGLAFDVAGVTIIGYGKGASRPTITIGTLTTATVEFTAANVTLTNFLFKSAVDALAGPIEISAADVTLQDIEYRDTTGSYQTVDCIVTTAAADRLHINGFVFRGDISNAGTQSAIQLVGGDGIILENIYVDGDIGTACIENVTTAATNLLIRDAYLRTRNSADICITLVSTATGWVGPRIHCRIADDAANITEAIELGDCNLAVDTGVGIANADSEATMTIDITASADA